MMNLECRIRGIIGEWERTLNNYDADDWGAGDDGAAQQLLECIFQLKETLEEPIVENL